MKNVVAATHANERAVKNWLSAKNAPAGPHLVALMRHSDQVLETFLLLADRKDLLKRKKLSDFSKILEQIRKLISDLEE